jgi:hypothetical protein
VLVAYAFLGGATAEGEDNSGNGMNSLERWNAHLDEVSNLRELSRSMGKEDPRGFSYLDGPYPNAQDNGALGTNPPDGLHMPWGSHMVSAIFVLDYSLSTPFNPQAGGGDFLLGDVHETWIGDQNGDGFLEWLVFFYYFPWESDGLDNDGDGCVDEIWPAGGCDSTPDALTVYETGGLPDIGGDKADLFTNVDWYSSPEAIEIYRAFVSPRWHAYQLRGIYYYPQMSGEFISYYADEFVNMINSNPEMDNERDDFYVGNIDARMFPSRTPVDHICSAGYQLFSGVTYERSDGWVVTSFELREAYDNHDWNGDGDNEDEVAAYYAVDPNNGNCRLNVVNIGVYGWYPRNTGTLLTPGYTWESDDQRDWNGDGDRFDTVLVYHNINSTWAMKGKVYTSFTFTESVPSFGFGWTAVYSDYGQLQTFPLEFGGAYYKYVGMASGYYRTYFFLTSDEDGNRHTMLPQHDLEIGMPVTTLGGRCFVVAVREQYAQAAGMRLMNSMADGNGDSDTMDTLNYIFCPDRSGGGGQFVVEPTSKFAHGNYANPLPAIWLGYTYQFNQVEIDGIVMIMFYRYEWELHDDCNRDMLVTNTLCTQWYFINISAYGKIIDRNMPKGDEEGLLEVMNDGGADWYPQISTTSICDFREVVSDQVNSRIHGLSLSLC